MTTQPIMRDKRTVATENASYRWAYVVLSFGLLVNRRIVSWRKDVYRRSQRGHNSHIHHSYHSAFSG